MTLDVAALAARLSALPIGTFRGLSLGRVWIVTRSCHAGGTAEKIVARALDGDGYVSANLYHLAAGPRLRPCGMPAARMAAFLADLAVS